MMVIMERIGREASGSSFRGYSGTSKETNSHGHDNNDRPLSRQAKGAGVMAAVGAQRLCRKGYRPPVSFTAQHHPHTRRYDIYPYILCLQHRVTRMRNGSGAC